MKRIYRAVLEAQLAALDAVRAGAATAAVDPAARKVLKGYGLDRAFVHSTGHGLGLEIHEPPRIGRRDKMRLQAGMAITIEPGVYLEGFGGIRIEDTVVVTETAAKSSPRRRRRCASSECSCSLHDAQGLFDVPSGLLGYGRGGHQS